MNPDISYMINFESSRKEQVIESLKKFCINTQEDSFNSALISDNSYLSFIVCNEEALNWYYESYEHSRRIKGKIVIGNILLWIREKQNECIFEFWATTSSTGKACLVSRNLFNEFIKLLEVNNGFEIKLDHSNGFIETKYINPNFNGTNNRQ
jgi:hypothetical protein